MFNADTTPHATLLRDGSVVTHALVVVRDGVDAGFYGYYASEAAAKRAVRRAHGTVRIHAFNV